MADPVLDEYGMAENSMAAALGIDPLDASASDRLLGTATGLRLELHRYELAQRAGHSIDIGGMIKASDALKAILERPTTAKVSNDELLGAMSHAGLVVLKAGHNVLSSARGRLLSGVSDREPDRHALLASVVRQPEAELGSALDRLIQAGLLFRQGVPPHATYLFKHALVQDSAYGTLLRESRRALHARIAQTLESKFTDAESRPELLTHHYTEAGLIDMRRRRDCGAKRGSSR